MTALKYTTEHITKSSKTVEVYAYKLKNKLSIQVAKDVDESELDIESIKAFANKTFGGRIAA
ncbi:MAG: hypothetical protein K9L22_08345 [Methylococcaceae bacterium]|nr:hypothetical protein [Methylococcaceae bacterium]